MISSVDAYNQILQQRPDFMIAPAGFEQLIHTELANRIVRVATRKPAEAAGASVAGIADHHKSLGLDCAVCHGPDKANLKEPTTADCTACHAVDALVAKTKDVKPTNPLI